MNGVAQKENEAEICPHREDGKASRIQLFNFSTPQMRAFHMTWIAFFLCFFAWFGIAPLMPLVRQDLNLTAAQVGNTIIASVAITVLARLLIGWMCDRYGPRLTYTGLLLLGSLPVMGIGLARDYETFLLFRLAIGAVGASFVITQFHTSVMFAPNRVGTANATTAGWGNMGGGAAQMLMPLLFAGISALGFTQASSWRLAMIIPGALMLVAGVGYYFLTQDTPLGNLRELRKRGITVNGKGGPKVRGSFMAACSDYRVWMLAMVYAACFGVEITIHNIAALFFTDTFNAGLQAAGMIVGFFGLLAIFARTLGGYISDRIARNHGIQGRVVLLSLALLLQGTSLVLFSRSGGMGMAVVMLLVFGLFVHTACGATYAVIPFINRRALGSVAGIVGAGGNVGAVLCGFLFRGTIPWRSSLLLLGICVTACGLAVMLVRFEPQPDSERFPIPQGAVPTTA
jgi:MFS transporter, NNP family, nitrate/nitrite transporter